MKFWPPSLSARRSMVLARNGVDVVAGWTVSLAIGVRELFTFVVTTDLQFWPGGGRRD